MMKWPLEVGIAEFRMQASLLRKSTFLLNRETNTHALRGLQKELSYQKTNKLFSSVSGSLERIRQAFLYWSCSRTFLLTSALVPIYAADSRRTFMHRPQEGIPTSGYSQSIFRKGGLKNPIPRVGEGGSAQTWICFQVTILSLRPG